MNTPNTPSPAPDSVGCRSTMNGKPVLHRDAKTVLKLDAEAFQEKLLCDGLILNPGDACAFRCACFTKAICSTSWWPTG